VSEDLRFLCLLIALVWLCLIVYQMHGLWSAIGAISRALARAEAEYLRRRQAWLARHPQPEQSPALPGRSE
jgi:hypothetical protein